MCAANIVFLLIDTAFISVVGTKLIIRAVPFLITLLTTIQERSHSVYGVRAYAVEAWLGRLHWGSPKAGYVRLRFLGPARFNNPSPSP